jgi:hypothetical protein
VTRAERSPVRRRRNACLLDVAIVFGDDHVELRCHCAKTRNWPVSGDLPPSTWVNPSEAYFEQTTGRREADASIMPANVCFQEKSEIIRQLQAAGIDGRATKNHEVLRRRSTKEKPRATCFGAFSIHNILEQIDQRAARNELKRKFIPPLISHTVGREVDWPAGVTEPRTHPPPD